MGCSHLVIVDSESDEPCADGSDSEGPDTDEVSSERSDDPLGDWDANLDELLRRLRTWHS